MELHKLCLILPMLLLTLVTLGSATEPGLVQSLRQSLRQLAPLSKREGPGRPYGGLPQRPAARPTDDDDDDSLPFDVDIYLYSSNACQRRGLEQTCAAIVRAFCLLHICTLFPIPCPFHKDQMYDNQCITKIKGKENERISAKWVQRHWGKMLTLRSNDRRNALVVLFPKTCVEAQNLVPSSMTGSINTTGCDTTRALLTRLAMNRKTRCWRRTTVTRASAWMNMKTTNGVTKGVRIGMQQCQIENEGTFPLAIREALIP